MAGMGADVCHTAEELRAQVRAAYSAVAENPGGNHPFPSGRRLAESLGYPAEVLDRIPETAVEAFCGTSNVSVFANIARGSRVLDLGCGAGLDSFAASARTGPGGSVIGVDFSASMVARAAAAARAAGFDNVSFVPAAAERLPLAGGSVDIALLNGIFNLNPARKAIFAELARVLRPGAAAYAAELIRVPREAGPSVPEPAADLSNWFA